jgi:hypothetical protein
MFKKETFQPLLKIGAVDVWRKGDIFRFKKYERMKINIPKIRSKNIKDKRLKFLVALVVTSNKEDPVSREL